jgi:uncharacterized protein YjbI with pentapeptide repeats
VGKRWGDPISEERQAELQGYLDRWEAEKDHGERRGPFSRWGLSGEERERLQLTGADVYWLAGRSERNEFDGMSNLHLEGADLSEAHLEGAWLNEAHLEGGLLQRTHLEYAYLFSTNLEYAFLNDVHLEGANLNAAHLEEAVLTFAHLERTNLGGARLERANLRYAWMDKTTLFNAVKLNGASLDQLSYDGVNLATVKWDAVTMLGDELQARTNKHEEEWRRGQRKDRDTRLQDHEAAVRANLQLAAVLRSQGISEQADRFTYRAKVLQRRVLGLRRRYGSAFGSWLLDLISGHGFKPGRSFITYLLVIFGFAAAFFAIGSGVLGIGGHEAINSPVSALVFSVTSFHGRGFFPGGGLALDDPITILAACEAVMGLFIEITFIATFTQRFFAR